MKKHWYIILAILLITVAFSACKNEKPNPKNEFPNPLAVIMASPEGQPQLSKKDFVEITNTYLSTIEWRLPVEKACFYTYGVNYSAYIIEDSYLFSLIVRNNADGSAVYDFCLSHYVDGVVTKTEDDPHHFDSFIK